MADQEIVTWTAFKCPVCSQWVGKMDPIKLTPLGHWAHPACADNQERVRTPSMIDPKQDAGREAEPDD